MWITLLISFYLFVYCPFALYEFRRLLSAYNKYSYSLSDVEEKYRPFVRYDVKSWNQWSLYLGALVLLPIRAPLVIMCMVLFLVVLLIAGKGSDAQTPWTFRFKLCAPILFGIAKVCVFLCGFQNLKRTIKQYSEFDPEYKRAQGPQTPAIIVSNHVSWYDIFIYISLYMTSFLSKESIKHYPIAGPSATAMKGVYVSRESEKSREQVLEALRYRAKVIQNGLAFPPIAIFPEGTTSNGRYLLSFKRGAFDQLIPVKICCIKYQDRSFNLGFTISLYGLTLLSLAQLHNSVEVFEFEGLYNPNHLNLDKYPEEQRWEIYAERVKDIMAKCLQVEKSKSGFREFKEYGQKYLDSNPCFA